MRDFAYKIVFEIIISQYKLHIDSIVIKQVNYMIPVELNISRCICLCNVFYRPLN
jgi:hypothetical protein